MSGSAPQWPLAKAGSGVELSPSARAAVLPGGRAGHPAERVLEQLDLAWAVFDDSDRLRDCNAAYARLLNRRSPLELIGSGYAELLESWLGALELTSEEQRAEFRTQRLRGRSARRTCFDVTTRSGLCLRVTERRSGDGWSSTTIVDRTEDAGMLAQQRAELESCRAAGAAKTEFLCSMSHELRTPLSSILGFAQLMQRDTKQPLPERHLTRVAHILQGGDHLVHVIDDLLDLSRIEAGRVAIACETIDTAAALDQLCTALEPLAQGAGIVLQRQAFGPGLPVTADPARFLQILMNFGSNAIKYNRPGGSVRLCASTRSPGLVRIAVSDTGIGIPSERHARVFEPFYRAGQERGSIPGTGMGLAICKRLAELMGGSVGFSSSWMQGSEFWVDLPSAS